MSNGSRLGFRIGNRVNRRARLTPARAQNPASTAPKASVVQKLALWLCLIGAIVPAAEVYLAIAGAKFTAGRLAVMLLLAPALFTLSRSNRRLIFADAIACVIGGWIILAAWIVGGPGTMSSAGAQCIELLGGYLAGRAFCFGPGALIQFVRALRIVVVVAVVIAVAEHVSGQLVLHNTLSSIFDTPPLGAQYRDGFLRAMATFDHAILFGAFCALSATIFLYAEPDRTKRSLSVGVCIFGAVLSLSSSALMSVTMVVMAFVYDWIMGRYPWRWGAFVLLGSVPILALSGWSGNPMGWVLSHLTLDPSSGFFRLMIWSAAEERIGQSPLWGYGFNLLDSDILDATVDSIWLVMALRFGLPMVVLMILWNFSVWRRASTSAQAGRQGKVMAEAATGFTMALIIFMFIGLTVHFWNYIWIFWGLCIGIRASLYEWSLGPKRATAVARPILIPRHAVQ